jgi:hypothetical protein
MLSRAFLVAALSILALACSDKEKDNKLAKLCVQATEQLGENAGKADPETFQMMLSNALGACSGGCDAGDDASCKSLDGHVAKICKVSPSVCTSLCDTVKSKSLKNASCNFKKA